MYVHILVYTFCAVAEQHSNDIHYLECNCNHLHVCVANLIY